MQYSEKFKDRMIRRMVGPTAVSAWALSREVEVAQSTLSRWLRDSLARVSDQVEEPPTRGAQQTLEPLEKARLVFAATELEGEALGAFMRRHGLRDADLAKWRAEVEERLCRKPASRETKAERHARQVDQARIKRLERELRKKDKALAETAALLVLQKKVQDLWGVEDDDTDPTSGGRS